MKRGGWKEKSYAFLWISSAVEWAVGLDLFVGDRDQRSEYLRSVPLAEIKSINDRTSILSM